MLSLSKHGGPPAHASTSSGWNECLKIEEY